MLAGGGGGGGGGGGVSVERSGERGFAFRSEARGNLRHGGCLHPEQRNTWLGGSCVREPVRNSRALPRDRRL